MVLVLVLAVMAAMVAMASMVAIVAMVAMATIKKGNDTYSKVGRLARSWWQVTISPFPREEEEKEEE